MPTYTILSAAVESSTEEKNSEFITFLHPVSSREEAMEHIDNYRAQYPDANHVCWAYVIGNTRQPITQAFSDDGEPSGTAGKPMLHVLTERDVGNSLAIVVRYFGGVKLGAGGLVRAYSGAVSAAVNSAELIAVVPKIELIVSVDFAREAKVRHLVNYFEGKILSVDYSLKVSLHISLNETSANEFRQQLINETAGEAIISTPAELLSH
ncbi:YigZ family protein [Cellvibrio sp. NN19]|uniref:YigZ family protein n=1 Tax=Cellvibrio chitinivorans TaxID=3102792 RepID=UPI002B409891|nr:YigZ family protein [Cellvibrio sp. NN19]